MSQRHPAFASFPREKSRLFALSAIGARFAYTSLMRGGRVLGSALLCVLPSACLVTDQVELPGENTTPPIVLAATPSIPLGSVIRFNANLANELPVVFHVRDDNVAETLKFRWHIVTGAAAQIPTDFDCPEPVIPPTGVTLREGKFAIDGMKLARGACSRVDIVVSAAFRPCMGRPDLFDVTEDEYNDLGRGMFWVWELSGDPLTNPGAAQMLASTCPTVAAPDRTVTNPTMENN